MEIYNRTWEGKEIVHTYPWGDRAYWRGPLENETDNINKPGTHEISNKNSHHNNKSNSGVHVNGGHHFGNWATQLVIVAILVLAMLVWRRYSKQRQSKKWQYTEIDT